MTNSRLDFTTGPISRPETAKRLGVDPSSLQKKLAVLAKRSSAIEKANGKWRLSALGLRLVTWAQDAFTLQKRILGEALPLRLGTTQPFAERVLIPGIATLRKTHPELKLLQVTIPSSAEAGLLKGEIDIGIYCGRPVDPLIRFKRLIPEIWIPVSAPQLIAPLIERTHSKGGPKIRKESIELPHICNFLYRTENTLGLQPDHLNTVLWLDHLIGIRAACIAGLEWGVLPKYRVQSEIRSGQLIELPSSQTGRVGRVPEPDSIGLGWLKGRESVRPYLAPLESWLKLISSEFLG